MTEIENRDIDLCRYTSRSSGKFTLEDKIAVMA